MGSVKSRIGFYKVASTFKVHKAAYFKNKIANRVGNYD